MLTRFEFKIEVYGLDFDPFMCVHVTRSFSIISLGATTHFTTT